MKKCSFCKQEIPKDSERCPHCSTVCKSYFDIFYDIRIIATIIVVFALLGNMVEKGSIPVEFFSNALSYQKTIDDTESNYVDIDIRPPYNLSGLSRDEILYNRKKYVNRSIVFGKLKNYTPNPSVYEIVDYLPWISHEQETKMRAVEIANISDGISRHSIHISNPELLLGLFPPSYNKEDYDVYSVFLDTTYLYQYPKRIAWDKKRNVIKSYFDVTKLLKGKYKYKRHPLFLDDTNARDFGYNWIYAYELKNIEFTIEDNISKKPYKMLGYYHRGYSCGLEGGCNNYSPRQPKLDLYFTGKGYIKFKLWKQKPLFTFQKPDMIYIMHFE